jgi:phenylacetate-CoA ligase
MYSPLVKRVLFPLHERLKGKPTLRFLRELEASQWLPPERLRELQWTRLRDLLRFAYDHVPYYRRLLDEHELPPPRVQTPDDFRQVPPLTREAIRRNFEALRASVPRPGVRARSSGGSTGAPVTILTDMQRMGFGEAARLRGQRWFGLDPGAREVCLWGSPIELSKQDRLRAWRDHLLNSRVLSAFDMDESCLARYARTISRVRPEKLYCYASAAFLFARYALRAHWTPPPTVRAMFTTAEMLFDHQRQVIRTAFRAPVAVEYGARDAGLMATECPAGRLHIPVEGMLIEIEDAGPDGVGEVVATNLFSHAMPTIRYRTGDLGALATDPCPCGRPLPAFERLDGRRGDFLVTGTGRVLHGQSIVHALRTLPGIEEFQVVQEALDRVIINIVPGDGFEAQRPTLLHRAQLLFGPETTAVVATMPAIPRSPSGKLRHVVSHVSAAYLDRMLDGRAT